MVVELRDHDVSQQPCGRDALVDTRRGNRCLDQRFSVITDPLASDEQELPGCGNRQQK
jgi:hypothetical protein